MVAYAGYDIACEMLDIMGDVEFTAKDAETALPGKIKKAGFFRLYNSGYIERVNGRVRSRECDPHNKWKFTQRFVESRTSPKMARSRARGRERYHQNRVSA